MSEESKPVPKICPFCGADIIVGGENDLFVYQCTNMKCPTFEYQFRKGSGFWMTFDIILDG